MKLVNILEVFKTFFISSNFLLSCYENLQFRVPSFFPGQKTTRSVVLTPIYHLYCLSILNWVVANDTNIICTFIGYKYLGNDTPSILRPTILNMFFIERVKRNGNCENLLFLDYNQLLNELLEQRISLCIRLCLTENPIVSFFLECNPLFSLIFQSPRELINQ